MSRKGNVVKDKSYAFSLKVISTYKELVSEKKEYILSKQLLRSGTSIGAMVREAEHAQSKPDFIHKMSIALKEANETVYWLELMKDSNYLGSKEALEIISDAEEILRLLISIVKTSRGNHNAI